VQRLVDACKRVKQDIVRDHEGVLRSLRLLLQTLADFFDAPAPVLRQINHHQRPLTKSDTAAVPRPRFRSFVSCLLSRWSGGRWPFTHGVGYHGLGDPFYEFGGHGHEHEARVELVA
jgi:hypothetical protein